MKDGEKTEYKSWMNRPFLLLCNPGQPFNGGNSFIERQNAHDFMAKFGQISKCDSAPSPITLILFELWRKFQAINSVH